MTGRHYPFRQFEESNGLGYGGADASERLGLSEAELTDILERYRQSFNLGVEDLARLIGAAELRAAAHRAGPTSAAAIMSRSLVTVAPGTALAEVADLFKRHRFTALPVTGPENQFLGAIFQLHLIDRARTDASRLDRGFGAAMGRLLDVRRKGSVHAADIMGVAGPRATADTPLGALLPMMADGDVDAVPVLERGRIVGIVTRTDVIGALARTSLR